MVGGILLGSAKVFGSRFPRFCHWWDVKPPRGMSFIFQGFRFHLLKLTPFFFVLLVEWQEVTKWFPTIRLGVEG